MTEMEPVNDRPQPDNWLGLPDGAGMLLINAKAPSVLETRYLRRGRKRLPPAGGPPSEA